ATVSSEQVFRTQCLGDSFGDQLQHPVACLMSVVVVESLEVVDVEHDQRQRLSVAQRKRQLSAQAIVEDATIVGVRQTVADRRVVDADDGLLFEFILQAEASQRALAEPEPDTVGEYG